jgi:hypothetical protein
MFELIKAEHARRREERSFWDSYKGWPCCGTMDSCPLKSKEL